MQREKNKEPRIKPVFYRNFWLRSTLSAASVCVLLLSTGCNSASVQQFDANSNATVDGLSGVRAKGFDAAFLRKDADFKHYTSLFASAPELAFKTPDRSKQQFPLKPEQKQKFQEILNASFREEFAVIPNLPLVDEVSVASLVVKVRVQNIETSIPTDGGSGKFWALHAAGKSDLRVELFDGESGELLARGIDLGVVEGSAALVSDKLISAWPEVEALSDHWAKLSRKHVAALVRLGGLRE